MEGEGLGSRAAGWSWPLVPPSGLQNGISAGDAVLELRWGRLSSPSWPPGLHPRQRKLLGCSSPALISHSSLGLMELKSSAWLPQAWGIAIRGAALVSKTISTLNITHGGHGSSSPGSILPALPSPGPQKPGCIQALLRLPARAVPAQSSLCSSPCPPSPGPGTAAPLGGRCCPAHVGLIIEHLLSIAAAQGRFPLAASCEGANFIYAGCLQRGRRESCGAGRQQGDGGLCPRQGERDRGGPRQCRGREAPLRTGAMGKLEASLRDAWPGPAAWRGARDYFQTPHSW